VYLTRSCTSIVSAILVFCGCSGSHPAPHLSVSASTLSAETSYPNQSVASTPRHGIRCTAWGQYPGPGQYNYSYLELGAPDVPKLSPHEVGELKSIEKRTKSKTIRFTILQLRERLGVLRQFIIFDAVDGPCADYAPGYKVLNASNYYYQPGENPYQVHAGPPYALSKLFVVAHMNPRRPMGRSSRQVICPT
jgi:hypothetical protein